MKGIKQSQKTIILSVVVAAAVSWLLWVSFDSARELAGLRPMINRQGVVFWLSIFLLLFFGIYFSTSPVNIDED